MELLQKLAALFLSPGSPLSLLSLSAALLIAVAFLSARRLRRGRRLRAAVLIRALFPRHYLLGASSRADIGLMLFNVLLFGLLFGWAMLSYRTVGEGARGLLTSLFGAPGPAALPAPVASAILTLAMFLAYEFGFWADHWLSHKVRFFWAFHKVHHTAETLSPLTNFRVHPIEGIKFANILALSIGLTFGLLTWLMGSTVTPLEFAGRNLVGFCFLLLLAHLQHTHLWIAFTGVWGRLFVSPAHHQIHHSANPEDFGKNLGSYLSIFDWLFGTLRLPARQRERLTFGAAPAGAHQHTIAGTMLTPFAEAMRPGAETAPDPRPAAAG